MIGHIIAIIVILGIFFFPYIMGKIIFDAEVFINNWVLGLCVIITIFTLSFVYIEIVDMVNR